MSVNPPTITSASLQ